MIDFLKRAWKNPRTTFGIGGSVLALLVADLSDGQSWNAVKSVKLAAGVVTIFAAAAASDAATQEAGQKS